MKFRPPVLKECIAVALHYDEIPSAVPVVTAAGSAEIAQKMKSIARRYGVPVVKRERVANELHNLKINQQIPVDLYQDIAVILRTKGRLSR